MLSRFVSLSLTMGLIIVCSQPALAQTPSPAPPPPDAEIPAAPAPQPDKTPPDAEVPARPTQPSQGTSEPPAPQAPSATDRESPPDAEIPAAPPDAEIPAAPAPPAPSPDSDQQRSGGAATGEAKVVAGGVKPKEAESAKPEGRTTQGNAQAQAAAKDTTAASKPSPDSETKTQAPKSKEENKFPIDIRGYTQVQYESHQDSEDQLYPDGRLLNQDRFVLRRARITLSREWQHTALLLQLDGNTVNGPAFSMYRAEATVYTNKPTDDAPSLAALTLGVFRTPFGYELTQMGDKRIFMERTIGSNALWPNETDLGARLAGGLAFFRYAVALVNGEPPNQRSGYGLQDPNAHKDISARFGAVADVTKKFHTAGGISFYRGKGFHGETPAPKPVIEWIDRNANGTVDVTNSEVQGSNATVRPSESFKRWMVGADVELSLDTRLGNTFVYGEAFIANNMDRGLFIADPTLTGHQDFREFGWYAALIQELGPYGLAGFRVSRYDPNSDLLEQRFNKVLPATQTITALSPLVGLVLPGRARLTFQYDFIKDYLARNSLGVPTDYKNNMWTLRLQVDL